MATPDHAAHKILATNRKAFRDYSVLDRIEAGIALVGTEVQSLRHSHANLTGSYAKVEHGSVWLQQMTIEAYEFGNRFNHNPTRPRRLLLHRREINKMTAQTEQKGLTIVPLSMYLKKGMVKVELGICKGKNVGDKRETLKRKTADLEAARAMRQR